MSVIRRVMNSRRFCTAAVASKAEEIMRNPDCRSLDLCWRVGYLVSPVKDLDMAAKYARLAAFTRIKTDTTALTCQTIIGAMVGEKRHKDAHDLYDYFFNSTHHKLRPNAQCCNLMIESRFQQGLVDEAIDFHHQSIESKIRAFDYPNDDTLRVLTKGLVHAGRLDEAEDLLRDERFRDLFPGHVPFNNVIRGFLDLGNLDRAKLVLDEFKLVSLGVVVDSRLRYPEYENRVAFLMATFMEYWFKQGEEIEAMECYNKSVLANKFPVFAETGNVLLGILLKYGKKTQAWELYHDMLDQLSGNDDLHLRGLNSSTVKIMLNECFDNGRYCEAIETYKNAKAKMKILSNGNIIKRCCENGMLSEAEYLFDADSETDCKTMMDAYVKDGRIDDALKISNKMIDATLKPLCFEHL